MTDLKKYDKAIRVHSQDEIDECYRLFAEAGAEVDEDDDYRNLRLLDINYFTHYANRVWRGSSFSGQLNSTIEYKDFREELEMEYKDNDILVGDGDYLKVLKALGNNCYVMSENDYNLDSKELDKYGDIYTKTELDNYGWKLYAEPDVKEMTLEEVSELVGKTIKIVEKKDE